jgi:putative ABC transport system permease protein
MPLFSRIGSLCRNLFQRRRVERELDDELRAYLDELTEEKRRNGADPVAARREARLELGGVEQVKEEVRQMRSGRILEELLKDLRYGARTLRRNPAFSAVAILALALGIGANTAMFSVAYGILRRPLPYPSADRIAVVYMRYFPRDFAFGTLCIRDFLTWRDNNHSFEEPSLFRNRVLDIRSPGRFPEQVQGAIVTAGFFSTLRVNAMLGRTFAAGDDKPAGPSLAVLSESLWRSRFASDPAVIGRTILVKGASTTVIGVMPGEFHLPLRDTEIWLNLPLDPPTRYGPWFYRGMARLKPGVTVDQARAELNQIGLLMMQQNPDYKRLALPVLGLRDALLGPTLKPTLLVLAGAVGLVLLIAVVNVANLMLARATTREREMALRLSLGAGRGRLVRQLIAESVLLAALGGAAGLLLAWGGVALIRAWNPGGMLLIDSVRLDGMALAFMLCVSLLTGILFGLAPALQSTRTDLNSTLKEGARGAGVDRARSRTRSALVIAEIAISLMLVVGAGLLLRSLSNLERVNAGFASPPGRLIHLLISNSSRNANNPAIGLAVYNEGLRRVRTLPGVELAAFTDSLPPDRQGDADTFGIEGQNLAAGELNPIVSAVTVGPGFFETLRIPLVKGRTFNDHDTPNSRPVAIVSEGFARRFLPGQDPIGKRIRQSSAAMGNPWMEIVGVVGNVKYLGLTADTEAAYYVPLAQSYSPITLLVARASASASSVADSLRRTVQSVDPGLTVAWVGTMENDMRHSVSQPRFDTALLAAFAAIALLLAAVGIYGLIAYSVAQRTHEIGVRMALGAARSDVVGMVLRQGASLAAIGIALGLAGAFALTRLLGTMLFGVRATDAVTFAAATAALLVVVLLAAWVPALRAARVSPVDAIRYE